MAKLPKRRFGGRAALFKELAQILCGNGADLESFMNVIEAGVWRTQLEKTGAMPEAIAGLDACIAFAQAPTDDAWVAAIGQIEEALNRYRTAIKAEAAAREEAERVAVAGFKKTFDVLFFEYGVSSSYFPKELFFKLQEEPYRSQFQRVYRTIPSIMGLRQTFKLKPPVWRELTAARDAAWAAAQQRWRECINAAKMPERLGITRSEFYRWRANGRIPVTFYTTFQKWGKELESTRHHPDDIAHITPELIAAWRDADKRTQPSN
ncbi:hypothetical protein KTD31_01345 [Burkholderia multivorans]|uniref:hypothetical protein n=1 Tax=Burkholderia multivorans TaxID=87883 RepID=UPI001C22D010|nr:hypothetical protein [Burkholderia multivorans]MBU9200047.1 hypothetical protein [Burkholderia multivorans]MDN8078834.1 hypothetical protein [Burkholderia multivorans]